MSPNSHAILSPSKSERWLNCPPSAQLETQFGDQETEAAKQGTAAHALAEHKVLKALKRQTVRPVSPYDDDEMEACTDAYRDFIMEEIATLESEGIIPSIFTEVPLDLTHYIPDGTGQSDCVIVSDKCLHIIDLKYGQGVLVDAENNTQLMIYALGSVLRFINIYDFSTVKMTIFQPRRDNYSSWTIPLDELLDWSESVLKPIAKIAFVGQGSFQAGPWCMFCKAADRCRCRAEAQLALAQYEFREPPLLNDNEIVDVLGRVASLVKWANDVKEYALDSAVNHGKTWPGYKLVESRSMRHYTDEEEVEKAANAAGYKDIYRKTLLTVTEMEKLMSKKIFNQVLGNLVYKPPGKPALVPESDKRTAMDAKTTAKEEFTKCEPEER
jgi:Protein of unknown function (DUF2800).